MSTVALWRVSTKILPPCWNISSKSKTLLSAGAANRQFSGSALTTPGRHSKPLNSLSDGRYSSSLSGVRMMHLSSRLDDTIITLTAPLYVDTSATGRIHWLKAAGDSISVAQPIAEIETDKATVEIDIPSPVNGFIQEILTPEGGPVKSGQQLVKLRIPDVVVPGVPKK